MLYRVRVDMCFEAEADAQALYQKVKESQPKAISLARETNIEGSEFIEIHKCYHDESPARPCEVIKREEVV